MADPLLTTLCSICHSAVPKYTCPGCHANTCSLACSQKHKAWANCTGKRDPTAYMPAAKLKTPAGVDHDYNFLSAIERERDRNQREIVEERGLFSDKQLRELGEDKRWHKMWFGEEVRFVSAEQARGRGPPRAVVSDGEDDGVEEGDEEKGTSNRGQSVLARRVRQRLEHANVEVVQMPVGMTRQRENITAWNRKVCRINWCVEWIIYDAAGAEHKQPTRIRHKALETMPVYKALGSSMAWHLRGQEKEGHDDEEEEELLTSAYARKRRRVLVKEVRDEGRRDAMQDADHATWLSTPYPTQSPYTSNWGTDRTPMTTSWLPDELNEARRHSRFYLLKPLTPAGKPKELIPIVSTETLEKALMGRSVLEYPTLYVLPPAGEGQHELPEGFTIGSTERRPKKARSNEKRKAADRGGTQNSRKRQAIGGGGVTTRGGRYERGRGRGRGGRGGRSQPRGQRNQAEDAEEGEINSDGDEFSAVRALAQQRADTSSSDPDTSSDEEGLDQDDMDVDGDEHPRELKAVQAAGKKVRLGLVEYDSDSDEGSEEEEEDEAVDLCKANPDNPELVAGAIQEIVGLLT